VNDYAVFAQAERYPISLNFCTVYGHPSSTSGEPPLQFGHQAIIVSPQSENLIQENTLMLARDLIRRESVTPHDAGCQQIIVKALEPSGFVNESMRFGDVQNLWLRRGESTPLLVFAGHTDVVPTGPIDRWEYPPFAAKVAEGILHGRGAADMKGSIAAMVTACQRFAIDHPEPVGSIALLITSDEEGPAVDGTRRVVEILQQRGETPNWCIVGEPTSRNQLGDTIKNGRRGSLDATIRLRGIQGHIAYPQLADNPIHRVGPLITALTTREWDTGNTDFPATSFQISNVQSGTGARNVIPGEIEIICNFRFSPVSSVETLRHTVEEVCQQYSQDFVVEWNPPSPVYHTIAAELIEATREAVR
jgi:succinyl-diaminopimelate desuccinylase